MDCDRENLIIMHNKITIREKAFPPMLVIYPFAFYFTTFACYLIFIVTLNSFWFKMAFVANAAGVLMALIGALPGFIDWSLGIGENTDVRYLGLKHMLCNIIGSLFFAVNLYSNSSQFSAPEPSISNAVFLSAAGLLCTIVASLLSSKIEHHARIEIDPLTPQEIEDATHITEQAISH